MRARKFCIITSARSGSNALVELLRLVPGTVCHGELFNKGGTSPGVQPRLGLSGAVADRRADPLGYLSEIEGETFKLASTFGFKLFMAHSPVVRDHVISSEEYRIILLSRANRLAQYASLEVAKASGVWHSWKRNSPEASPAILFDREDFEVYTRRINSQYARAHSELKAAGRSAFTFEYTDLRNIRVLDALGAFLGLGDAPALSTLAPSIPTVKQSRAVIVERFSNPDSVVAAMREIGREDWLGEEGKPAHV